MQSGDWASSALPSVDDEDARTEFGGARYLTLSFLMFVFQAKIIGSYVWRSSERISCQSVCMRATGNAAPQPVVCGRFSAYLVKRRSTPK